MFAAQPAKNSAKIVAKTKFFIFSPLIKCLSILSNLSFINRVKFELAAKRVKFKGRGKFDAPSSAKIAKFLSLAAFFTDFKIIFFLCVEARNDIRKTSKNVNLSKIKAFFAKLA